MQDKNTQYSEKSTNRFQKKVLYISDLDGTLMNDNEEISSYSADVINNLVKEGMHFAYATARSYITASKITRNLTVKIPIIIYNGAFIVDNKSDEILLANYFAEQDHSEILNKLILNGINPIVYSHVHGVEKFSYVSDRINNGTKEFVKSRQGDRRDNPVNNIDKLGEGKVFYFACIDKEEKLLPMFEYFKSKYSCVYQKDTYSGEQWLEIMPKNVNKAMAILQLKELLKCEKVISFGDGKNDIPMFQISDECYAMDNATDELKSICTGIIGSNNDDGVAKWLKQHAK